MVIEEFMNGTDELIIGTDEVMTGTDEGATGSDEGTTAPDDGIEDADPGTVMVAVLVTTTLVTLVELPDPSVKVSVVLSASVVVKVDENEEPAANDEDDMLRGIEDGVLLATADELPGDSRKHIEYLRSIL